MKKLRLFRNQKGQGMMEYMIITAVVGIFCLGAMKNFGDSVNTRIDQMKRKITSDIIIK